MKENVRHISDVDRVLRYGRVAWRKVELCTGYIGLCPRPRGKHYDVVEYT